MNLSVLDFFTIGIGPSSSHTVGPMRAAHRFVDRLTEAGVLGATARVEAHLYGSLALTGKGHGTDRAVLFGLEGETPETIDIDSMAPRLEAIRAQHRLRLGGTHEIAFDEKTCLLFHRTEALPAHPNGLRFFAFDAAGVELLTRTYYSIGGGFVVNEGAAQRDEISADHRELPYPFRSGDDLLRLARESGLSVSEMTLRNEAAWRPEAETRAALLRVCQAMRDCIERGCRGSGLLPGGLHVPRRAPALFRELTAHPDAALRDPLIALDWVSLWAMAVNEENAAGGRVVTAPTSRAHRRILPADPLLPRPLCWHGVTDDRQARPLSPDIPPEPSGILYKLNASISGAEVGCQGEVGVACSMAADSRLCEVHRRHRAAGLENAAEIGMEHNLWHSPCDPVGGLVQVPCMAERNAMGAVKAINAARLALRGDGTHRVSLDRVIATMRQTGADMSTKYKETSRGGLAVNVTEC